VRLLRAGDNCRRQCSVPNEISAVHWLLLREIGE
jgi:hypothetical protein